jgi:hypothetical protein
MGYIYCDNHMPTNSPRILFYYLLEFQFGRRQTRVLNSDTPATLQQKHGIVLLKEQFIVTHTTRQTDCRISRQTHPLSKCSVHKKKLLLLIFSKNITS